MKTLKEKFPKQILKKNLNSEEKKGFLFFVSVICFVFLGELLLNFSLSYAALRGSHGLSA